MRKLISTIFLAILLSVLVVPAVSSAQETLPDTCWITHNLTDITGCPNGGTTAVEIDIPADGSTNAGMCCLINTVYTITDWLFYLILIAVVLMGVIGGALYMTSAGDTDRAGKGKSVIIFAVIGLVLALIAKLIPSVVRLIIGM